MAAPGPRGDGPRGHPNERTAPRARESRHPARGRGVGHQCRREQAGDRGRGRGLPRLDALELEVLDEAALSARLGEIERSVPLPTEGVPTYHRPDMTPAETCERAWRAAEERR